MDMEARVSDQPTAHGRDLVGAVVIEDEVEVEVLTTYDLKRIWSNDARPPPLAGGSEAPPAPGAPRSANI